jgi:hypothetical protein
MRSVDGALWAVAKPSANDRSFQPYATDGAVLVRLLIGEQAGRTCCNQMRLACATIALGCETDGASPCYTMPLFLFLTFG